MSKSMIDAPPRRVAVNSGYLLVAYVLEAALSLLVLSLVARYLDQAGFGRYGYVISFIELFIMLTELSNSRVQVREMAADLPNAKRPLSEIWTLRLGLSALTTVVVIFAAPGLTADPELWWAIVLFGLGQAVFVLAEVFNGVFRAYQQMRYQTYTVVAGQILITGFCVLAILFDWGLVGIFAVRVAANLVRLAYAWYLSRSRFIHEGLSTDWRRMWHILKESFPLGLNLILRRLIWRGGMVLMTNLLNQRSPGAGDLASGLLYGPLRLVEQMRIVPTALVGAMLPVFAQQAQSQPKRFRKTLADSYKLLMVLSFLLTVTISALAVPLTRIALGQGLIAAAGVLAVFGWTVPVSFANQFYESALLALGRQRVVAIGLAIGFLVSLALSWFYLVPVHQAIGVAYAILIAEGIAFIVGFAAMLPYFDAKALAVNLGKIGVACAAAAGVFYLLRDVTFWVSAPAGVVAFVIATLLVRTFAVKELEAILAMVTFHKRLRWIRHRIFGLPEAAPVELTADTKTEDPQHDIS